MLSKTCDMSNTNCDGRGCSPEPDEPKKSPRTKEMSKIETQLTLEKNLVKTDRGFCLKKEIDSY